MPVPLLSAASTILLACCCATADPPSAVIVVATPTFREPRVITIIPGHDRIELVLAAGERAGLAVGDRGYMRCLDAEVRITEVFELRSRARMDLTGSWPEIGPVRIYLHGATPSPWCPDRE